MATADEADKPADDQPRAGKTAGQRLAAAKAAKAAAKAAKRGRQAELVESKALKRAEAAGDWARRNKRALWMAIGAVVLVVAGATAWSIHSESQAQEASAVLWAAVETARAEIRPEEVGPDPDGRTTYPTLVARAERAAERYAKVIEDYPNTEAAVWALLGRGNALYELGQHEEARGAHQRALGQGGDDPIVAWRALEGIGFTYEAEEKWDEAIARFDELGDASEGAWRDIADYHLARMHLAKGDEERGKELLRTLVERLRGDDREGAPSLDYVQAQAELRLAAIDSSLVPPEPSPFPGMGGGGMGAGPGGGPGDISPEQLQQIIEQLQKSAGGAPGGGE